MEFLAWFLFGIFCCPVIGFTIQQIKLWVVQWKDKRKNK